MQPISPPYYIVDQKDAPYLELGGTGSYQECQALLQEFQRVFGATYSVHLEVGDHPEYDKEKGYWSVRMFGQEFLLMRHRGVGMSLLGPRPPADVRGFRQVAEHFGARESVSWLTKMARRLGFVQSVMEGPV